MHKFSYNDFLIPCHCISLRMLSILFIFLLKFIKSTVLKKKNIKINLFIDKLIILSYKSKSVVI
jgi:hypothetical protein